MIMTGGGFGGGPADLLLLVLAILMCVALPSIVLNPASAVAKVWLWLRGICFFIFWGEKKGMSSAGDAAMVSSSNEKSSKRIIFIRHGESDWNYVFNKEKHASSTARAFAKRAIWHSQFLFYRLAAFGEGVEQAVDLQSSSFKKSKSRKIQWIRMSRQLREATMSSL